MISSIQRMSLHDGPGIRTTFFLKGCNYRCFWCHNPETLDTGPELELVADKCIACGHCLSACPDHALSLSETVQIDREKCSRCFECVPVCYPEALQRIGSWITVEKLVAMTESDRAYFTASGGGVTLSGGEPMLQGEFVLEALKGLKACGIHTALDTNLSLPWSRYEKILPHLDLLMGDIKCMDDVQHRQGTGEGNRRVIENIQRLDRSGAPYWLRTPVIPGFNACDEAMESLAVFLSSLANLQKHELLPYHPLGEYKYQNLGRARPFPDTKKVGKETMERFQEMIDHHPAEGVLS